MSAEKLVKSLKMQEKKANVPKKERQVQEIEESLGLRDPVQLLENDLMASQTSENAEYGTNIEQVLLNPQIIKNKSGGSNNQFNDAQINDILGKMGMQEASPSLKKLEQIS
jgi:hypothetical protein